jgi:hypothetical protein
MSSQEDIQEYTIHLKVLCTVCGQVCGQKESYDPGYGNSDEDEDDYDEEESQENRQENKNIIYDLYCNNCQSFGINCCICEQSLRGSALFCGACGHGGHVKELSEWFVQHTECASGCGCRCSNLAFDQQTDNAIQKDIWNNYHVFFPVDPMAES